MMKEFLLGCFNFMTSFRTKKGRKRDTKSISSIQYSNQRFINNFDSLSWDGLCCTCTALFPYD
jgi:hypothetical protein